MVVMRFLPDEMTMRRGLAPAIAALFLILLLVNLHALASPLPRLTVDAFPRSPLAGETIAVTITVSNPGPSVFPLLLRVDLPAGMTYVPGTAQLDMGSGEEHMEPAIEDGSLLWRGLRLHRGRTGNIRGINTFLQDHCQDAGLMNWQLDRARDLVGPGGVVKQVVFPVTLETRSVPRCWVDFVWGAYERGLDPILRLQGAHNGAFWETPDPRGAYAYAEIAARYRDFVAGLPRVDGRTLYIQVWNEPNRRQEWGGHVSPEAYARFFSAVADAIHSLEDPRIKVLNAPLAPGGDYDNLAFIDAMFTAVPEALWKFDVWAAHAYPGNHPPEYNHHAGTARPDDRHTIDAYLLEVNRLARWGRVDVPVILSETGYALGDASSPGYPPIDEWNRAEYMRRAFVDYWSRWPELVAVAPFQLSDPDRRWSAWDWVAPYGNPHPQYTAVAALDALPDAEGRLVLTFHARVGEVSTPTVVHLTARAEAPTAGWLPLTHTISLLIMPRSPTPAPCPACTPPASPTASPAPTRPPAPTPTPVSEARILGVWEVGREPHGLALDPVTRRLFVANYGDASISVLNAEAGTQMGTISLPGYWGMHNLAWWPNGGALVVTLHYAGGTLVLPQARADDVRFLPTGDRPEGMAIAPDVGRLFITGGEENVLAVVNATSWYVEARVPTGRRPAGVAYDPYRHRVAVVNTGDNTVTLVDARSLAVVDTLAVGDGPHGVVAEAGGLVVANRTDRTLTFLRYDGRREDVAAECTPYLLAVDESLGHLYVLCEENVLAIWHLAARQPLATFSVPAGEGLMADTWAHRVYVSNSDRDTVMVIQDTVSLNHSLGLIPTAYVPLISR